MRHYSENFIEKFWSELWEYWKTKFLRIGRPHI